MEAAKSCLKLLVAAGQIGALLISFPATAPGQEYPHKPITIYCGYAAGASHDIATRALASGAEKLLGVPVIVENKPGGGAAVCAGLVASKNPDGYTLGEISAGPLTTLPHLTKLPFNPLKDFTFIMQYTLNVGGLCVLSESPIKTIDEFITHAKAHPGLSYASPGRYTANHLSMELFSQCKGLTFKHLPTKGGAEANTLLLGKHTDFVAGGGQHIMYVKKEVFRMLAVSFKEKRDPNFPNIPTMKEMGCPDVTAPGYIVVGPRGMSEAVSKKLGETFKKVADEPAFQKVLASFDLTYEYKNRAQIEKEIPVEFERIKNFLKGIGVKKED